MPCGHCLCETCVKGWFSSILVDYCKEHEDFDPCGPLLQGFLESLRDPDLNQEERRLIVHQLRDLYIASEKPRYTCPQCRCAVTMPPTYCIWVKGVVEELAEWAKEEEKVDVVQGTPWEIFFPLHEIGYF